MRRRSKHIALRPTFPLFVQTNWSSAFPFSHDQARALAQRQPLCNKCVSPDDPFHVISVYNENCAACVAWTAAKAYETWPTLEATCLQAKRLMENEDPMVAPATDQVNRFAWVTAIPYKSPRDCPHAMTGDTHCLRENGASQSLSKTIIRPPQRKRTKRHIKKKEKMRRIAKIASYSL